MRRLKRLSMWILVAVLGGASVVASAKIMVLGGNPPGSLWYAQSQALATVVSKHSDLKVDVLPQGSSVFFPMFATQEVDMGLANPTDAKFAMEARWPFEGVNKGKGYRMRAVMLGAPNRLSLVTAEDSGINSLQDLKGKRVVANYGAFSGATITAQSTLANAGLSNDDIEVVNVSSYPEGVRAVIEGRADAAVGSLGSGIVQELDAARGAKFLEIDRSPQAMARTRDVGPAFVPMLVKKGPPGIDQETWLLGYSTTVVARPDLDEQTVMTFIDTVWKHYKELAPIHRSLVNWTPDRFASTEAIIPYHPAAVKYYKQKGVWNDELEKHQAALVKRYGN